MSSKYTSEEVRQAQEVIARCYSTLGEGNAVPPRWAVDRVTTALTERIKADARPVARSEVADGQKLSRLRELAELWKAGDFEERECAEKLLAILDAEGDGDGVELADNELPGMWSSADFTGGDPDERNHDNQSPLNSPYVSAQGLYFNDAVALADWLESLYECDASRSITGNKWDVAQRAAQTIRLEIADGMQPSRPKPRMPVSPLGIEDFCFCNDEVSLQWVSGAAAPEGYLGRVQLKINGEFVSYIRQRQRRGEQLAEGSTSKLESEIHKIAKAHMSKREQGYFMSKIRGMLAAFQSKGSNR